MNFYRTLPASRQEARASVYLAVYMFALFVLMFGSTASAAEKNTAFLPLKINTSKDAGVLASQADTALNRALAEHELTPLSRVQAQGLADYAGSWPPAAETLQAIAAASGTDNVAAGSLTQIGQQLSIDIKVFDALSPSTPKYFFQSAQGLAELPRALDTVILDILAYTGREYRIASIAPEGNTRVDSGAILRKIKSRAGGAYNPSILREDLRAIYAMGYFNDVQIRVSDSDNGKNVVFRVVEKPVIASVTFSGVKDLSEEEVRGAANVREHFILNPTAVNQGVEAIKELYKSKGYYNTKVEVETTFPSDAGAVVRYSIDEGKKIYIKKISIEGNTAFSDKKLLKQIESGEKGFFSWLTASGLLDMEVIRQDSGRIASFYHDNGYLEAKIGDPLIRQEKEWIYVTFKVEEGERFKVGNIDISGDLITDKSTLINLISLRDQEYMSRSVIREDVMAITDYYSEQGYAFANVRPDIKESAMLERLDVNFVIDKADLVYINRITISGNDRTRDNVIRRELRLAEGGVFNSKALRQSSQALQRLQFFDEVNITPEPTIDPTRMNINIEVKERSTGSFSIGAGYSSVDNIIVMGSISENNFLGRGDTLQFSANIGGSSTAYNLSYTNPRLNDSQLSWGIDLFDTEREYDDYTRESTGGGIRVGYPIWERWRVYGNYSYSDTQLSDYITDEDDPDYNFRIAESAKVPITSAMKVTFSRDTRNKLFGATKGSKHSISAKYAGGPLSGDSQFTKLEASTSWYFPFVLDTTIHLKGAVGQAFENEDDKFPIYERFFLGGIRTVRGFEYAKISPQDDNGNRIGGDKMWYTNFEFIFPIVEEQGIQGLTFFDAGQVLDDSEDWNVDDVRTSVGAGLRWLSPLGPISFVYGVNLDPEDDEDSSVFDFSIGGTF